MPYMQSLKQVNDLCQGPPNARNHLAVRTEVKINSRVSPAILRDGAHRFPSRKWEEQSKEQGHYVLSGGQREGSSLCPRALPVLKRSEGLYWVTAEKKQNFLEQGGGAKRKKQNGKT